MEKIRVLLMDDHSLMLMGIKTKLELAGDIEVVGEATELSEGMRLITELEPDVVVLDVTFKGEDSGIRACDEIKSRPDPPLVLIHSAHDTDKYLAKAATAQADGYLNKGAELMDLPDAIRRVYAGQRPWIMDEVEDSNPQPDFVANKTDLTSREYEVYVLVSKRYSNEDIAKKLYTSVYTVKNQVSSILRKTNVDSRKKLYRSY